MVGASLLSGALLFASAATSLAAAKSVPFGQPGSLPIPHEVLRRSVTGNGNNLNGQTYDYVVVGGGLAGLVVAGRLSENPDVTVAVIEAGDSGYDDNRKFVVPSANLYDSAANTKYDWKFETVAQSGLNNRVTPWARGKVLGGSAAINGLYYVRHSEVEQNAWAKINGEGPDGTWGWNNMLRAMKKSENFTPPRKELLDAVDINFNPASHGTDGPLHVSWPARSYPPVASFLQSVAELGTAISQDPDAGQSWGAFVATSTINPTNWTRSFSRTAYLDPYAYRSNLHVLTGHTVTKVLFDQGSSSGGGGDVRATGVQYSAASGSDRLNVNAAREVILCGGSVNDPQILQLSGIGDRSLLERHNVPVIVDLPGVGHHVQDHVSAGLTWEPSQPSDIPPQRVTNDPVTDSYVNSAIAYVGANTLYGDYRATLVAEMRQERAATVAALDAPEAVKRGYDLTYGVQVDDIFTSDVGPIELLCAISFGGLSVQAALQQPLSRGSILIQSSDPFAAPLIDAGYLTNRFDLETMRTGFKLARQVANTKPLSDHMGSEQVPGSSVSSDADWDRWIKDHVQTEYHPSCSCAMLPRSAGGVVGTDLKVYGTRNLRVIDAAVPPISLSAHLMAATYGLAEIGAELVLKERDEALKQSSSSGGGSSSPASGNASGSTPVSGPASGAAASGSPSDLSSKSSSAATLSLGRLTAWQLASVGVASSALLAFAL
ncbi:uncharacterized protein PFL1_02915 [Pseudozyma flocculosa PF-1]|uniref:Related to Glucose oxidase n=2 Tax=Pseudozyma flocculosa TaxID=84751 RepID=A0A5C3F4W3_9BASI|nr:uncharacterized protein PFL1_02915 [Pseudozyma flocculosa PF-1]EPQ29695.1 hypothetical protein PFL1_02915 [Pseudozyma flocculosa PF-1]SPO38271.1 related to Glucose oxidase [Pseudozyma flocculosa]